MRSFVLEYQWARWLPDRWVLGLATCGRVGYWGRAPGTNGSLLGLVLFTVFFAHGVPVFSHVMAMALIVWLAVGICGEAEIRMRKRDPGEIVLDEVVAVPLCFVGIHYWSDQTGHLWAYMIGGFLLFRLFDILKPFGIRRLQRLRGGAGVVADDLAAAFATLLVLHIAGYWITRTLS